MSYVRRIKRDLLRAWNEFYGNRRRGILAGRSISVLSRPVDAGMFTWQRCFRLPRVSPYPFRKCLLFPLCCSCGIHCGGFGPVWLSLR